METPRKRVKHRATRSSQGIEPRTSRTRKHKQKRSSLDYASLKDEKDYRPSYIQRISSKQPKTASVIVPRPDRKKRNRRDPFDVLVDDAVHLVISYLAARDTETLRRVSKLWKASSEAHCGRNALQQHFPLAAAKTKGCGSRLEENLRFRRHLHFHESLAVGNATRALRCTAALDWHLEHDTLVWSNKKGDVSVRTLRSRGENVPMISSTTSIDFRSFNIPFAAMNSVQLTEDGDMIVDLQGDGGGDGSSVRCYDHKLMKITQRGAVLWETHFASLMSMPAVGKNALYLIERLANSPTSEPVLEFVKMALDDGSISYRTQLPQRYCRVQSNESDKHLRLFCNDGFALWRDKANTAYVFSTKTGTVIPGYLRTTRTPPIVGRESNCIWDINPNLSNPPPDIYRTWPEFHHSFSQLVTIQEEQVQMKFEGINFPSRIRYTHSEWRFSGDHSAFLYFTHDILPNVEFGRRLLGQNEFTDPYTTVWVSLMEKENCKESPFLELKEKASAFPISLPSLGEKLGERRPLELDLPWRMKEDDYLAMADDYLVYHSPEEEILLLVDFWPNW
ncbi:hypothetical protein MMC07_008143 [Pseudocyphellaria aurata]|nr:hypothetical protein [Pseudocyphellaria aurata]